MMSCLIVSLLSQRECAHEASTRMAPVTSAICESLSNPCATKNAPTALASLRSNHVRMTLLFSMFIIVSLVSLFFMFNQIITGERSNEPIAIRINAIDIPRKFAIDSFFISCWLACAAPTTAQFDTDRLSSCPGGRIWSSILRGFLEVL